jgi:hypothetical protein
MQHKFFKLLCIAFSCFLLAAFIVVPVSAAPLGYQYEFDYTFTFSDFSQVPNTNWYEVTLGPDFDPVVVSGDQISFRIDTYQYIDAFQVSSFGQTLHYIGNAYPIFGYGEDNDLPYCLSISPGSSEGQLYIRSDLFSPLFHGDTQQPHIAVSIAINNDPPPPSFSDFGSIFSIIGTGFLQMLGSLVSVFWFNGALTAFGIFAVISSGIGFAFLLIRFISTAFRF